MSQEVIQVVKQLDSKNIEIQLALQCGPLITGLKIANLFIVDNDQVDKVEALLDHTCIKHITLYTNKNRSFLLLYRQQQLKAYLEEQEVKAFMEAMGYSDLSLNEAFWLLKKRYSAYMEGRDAFPHEFGLFLGYPVEDVIGFIENQGKNFLCTGYWKVYKNLNEKQQLFKQFEEAIELLIRLLSNGVKLVDTIDMLSGQRAS